MVFFPGFLASRTAFVRLFLVFCIGAMGSAPLEAARRKSSTGKSTKSKAKSDKKEKKSFRARSFTSERRASPSGPFRADSSQVSGELGFTALRSPIVGAGLNFDLTSRASWGFMFASTSGQVDINNPPLSFGSSKSSGTSGSPFQLSPISVNSLFVGARYSAQFFDSWVWTAGMAYERLNYNLQLNPTIPVLPTIKVDGSAQQLDLLAAVGQRFRLAKGLSFGVDWVGFYYPAARLSHDQNAAMSGGAGAIPGGGPPRMGLQNPGAPGPGGPPPGIGAGSPPKQDLPKSPTLFLGLLRLNYQF
jgi:hypothetical protein